MSQKSTSKQMSVNLIASIISFAVNVGINFFLTPFLVKELGMDGHDAGMLLSIAGNLRVCQVVDPEKTFRMEIPRSVTKAYGYQFR